MSYHISGKKMTDSWSKRAFRSIDFSWLQEFDPLLNAFYFPARQMKFKIKIWYKVRHWQFTKYGVFQAKSALCIKGQKQSWSEGRIENTLCQRHFPLAPTGYLSIYLSCLSNHPSIPIYLFMVQKVCNEKGCLLLPTKFVCLKGQCW